MSMLHPERIPNHVAIIPDGNRRWAKKRGKEPWEGHEAGAHVTEQLIESAREIGIRELSFWGSSLENLTKRPLEEKQALLRIYLKNFTKLLESPEIHEHEVQVRCLGRWEEQFPEELKILLRKIMDTTRSYGKRFLNFFLAYNGDDDMLRAVRRIVGAGVTSGAITAETLKQHLMTAEVSPVDLLIRTGGDPHLSAGFMMWETKDAQLAFPDVYYPDFTPELFRATIADYADRERRFGR